VGAVTQPADHPVDDRSDARQRSPGPQIKLSVDRERLAETDAALTRALFQLADTKQRMEAAILYHGRRNQPMPGADIAAILRDYRADVVGLIDLAKRAQAFLRAPRDYRA